MPRLRPAPQEQLKLNARELIKYKKGLARIPTIEGLGERIGITRSTMGDYINDITKMPTGKLIRMFEKLNFSDSEILFLLKGGKP